MTLIEGFVKDEIFIDFGADVLYGSDQCNVSYPCRFPTVEFQLMATNGLSQIADRIRKDAGFRPMHPMDEYISSLCKYVLRVRSVRAGRQAKTPMCGVP